MSFLLVLLLSGVVVSLLGPVATQQSGMMIWFEMIFSLVLFVLPVLIWFFYTVRSADSPLVDLHRIGFWLPLVAVCLPFIYAPALDIFSRLNALLPLPGWMVDLERQAQATMEAVLYVTGFWEFLRNILVVALVPAVCEELFFRGALQRILIDLFRRRWLGIVVTSLIFGLAHLQFQTLLPRFLLGLLLGWMYVLGRSLVLPSLMHFINNSVVVVAYFLSARQGINPEDFLDIELPVWIVVLSLTLTLGLLIFLPRLRNVGRSRSRGSSVTEV